MNKRVMTKWVRALRSGKYKQGNGQLKGFIQEQTAEGGYKATGAKFCCLGVACDLGLTTPYKGEAVSTAAYVSSNFLSGEAQCKLATMNDSGRYGFKRLANYIEKNYKELSRMKGKGEL